MITAIQYATYPEGIRLDIVEYSESWLLTKTTEVHAWIIDAYGREHELFPLVWQAIDDDNLAVEYIFSGQETAVPATYVLRVEVTVEDLGVLRNAPQTLTIRSFAKSAL